MNLLFHHTNLHFYVAALNYQVSHKGDEPTIIGTTLCKSKRQTTAEYALYNLSTSITVSTYQLPERLQHNLLVPERLEMKMEAAVQAIEAQSKQSGDYVIKD